MDKTNKQYDIIQACRKTDLKNNGSTWVKSASDNFNVPMDILRRIISPEQMSLYLMMG